MKVASVDVRTHSGVEMYARAMAAHVEELANVDIRYSISALEPTKLPGFGP